MSLFLDEQKLSFEKLGMEARLSEDPTVWHQQVLDELYRQVPYASDYNPKIELRTIDPERMYGLGHVELINKLAINARDDDTPPALKGNQRVILPIVIQDALLKPLDLMIHDGKVEPVTEERLRRALFRPNLHEAVRERPGDMSLIEQLYPPHRQFGGGRGLVSDAGAGSKLASARPDSVLDAIMDTIDEDHLVAFTEKVASDVTLRSSLIKNTASREYLAKLAAAVPSASGFERFKKVASTIIPNVMQVQKIDGGFRIKTANTDALAPSVEDVSRPEAVGALGGDIVSAVDRDGAVTLANQEEQGDAELDAAATVVDTFGFYKVKTMDGREMSGWVFPQLMDLDGSLLPMAAFANGTESGMQEVIAGSFLDDGMDIPDMLPSGTGMFVFHDGENVQGLVPMEISGVTETPEGASYICETVMGTRCECVKVPGLQTVTPISEGRYGLPEKCGFMSLENIVDLVATPDEFSKQAQARAIPTAVRVSTDGNTYSFSGEPVTKLAGVMDTDFLSRNDATFVAACLGYSPQQFVSDLQGMRKHGHYDLWFKAKPVTTLKEKYAEAKQSAKGTLAKIASIGPVRFDLSKEASVLEDPAAVDKVLSLGFINAENVSIFAGYIPEFENTIARLSELLMATRLGLQSVDEGALQKSIIHLDKVVAGLKTLGRLPQV